VCELRITNSGAAEAHVKEIEVLVLDEQFYPTPQNLRKRTSKVLRDRSVDGRRKLSGRKR